MSMQYNWIKTDSEQQISRFKQLIDDGLEVPTRRTLEGRYKDIICHSGYNPHSGDLVITNDEYEDWEEMEANGAFNGLEFLDPEPQQIKFAEILARIKQISTANKRHDWPYHDAHKISEDINQMTAEIDTVIELYETLVNIAK